MKEYNLITNKLKEDGNSIFDNNPVLRLFSYPLEKELKTGGINKIEVNKNQLWINCECYDYDISIDTAFDIIFKYSNIAEYKEITAALKYITVKADGTPSHILPRGYFALCLIEFDIIPDMLSFLRYSGKILNKEKNDILFLTKKNVLDEMLKLYDE